MVDYLVQNFEDLHSLRLEGPTEDPTWRTKSSVLQREYGEQLVGSTPKFHSILGLIDCGQ
jgi:hypothetical protein